MSVAATGGLLLVAFLPLLRTSHGAANVGDVKPLMAGPCRFNPMCSCKGGEVACVGVPFYRLPDIPREPLEHVDVVGSGLARLEEDAFSGCRISSLRLMSNNLFVIAPKAFESIRDDLQSLDLSYNKLDEPPWEALESLNNLDWLNLHGNRIVNLDGDWTHLKDTLRSLYLGENDLLELTASIGRNGAEEHDASGLNSVGVHNGVKGRSDIFGSGSLGSTGTSDYGLPGFRRLATLDLDRNRLRAIEPGSLPSSLRSLSAAHNLITEFPIAIFSELPHLSVLSVRGNLIKNLPTSGRTRRMLDHLDLADNLIRELPQNIFNGSLQVRDLHLELNQLHTFPAQAVRGLSPSRLFLGHNQIANLSEHAFAGAAHTLEYLDIDYNSLQGFPKALKHLKRLKYLYIGHNSLRYLGNETLRPFSDTLRALSLAGNRLTEIPAEALRPLRKLSHLNLGYNMITDLFPEHFAGWGAALDTLLLPSNILTELPANLFVHAPGLRELSISFNKFRYVDPLAFADVAASLESLEASFSLWGDEYPEELLRPLGNLLWLALDNNNIRVLNRNVLHKHPKLQYINLESNLLSELPQGFFHSSIHSGLREVRLSYNSLSSLETGTLAGLSNVQTVSLTGNHIKTVSTEAFHDLPSLVNVLLARNGMLSLKPRSFVNTPLLKNLDLHGNKLKTFSLNTFANVSSPEVPLNLNLSLNHLSQMLAQPSSTVHIHTLDVSHNHLIQVPTEFLNAVGGSLSQVFLNYNKLSRIDARTLGNANNVQLLDLGYNDINTVVSGAFEGYTQLQVIKISHNHIQHIQQDQFIHLSNLRVVDLSKNRIRSLPKTSFHGTRLERLDLSDNLFVVVPSSALEEVGKSLRSLDLSGNQIEHLDSTMFPGIPWLNSLSLANNKLSFLPDNVFSSLGGLLSLNLASNPLRANFAELFHYQQELRSLSLAETGIGGKQKPLALPLPYLMELNLTGNAFEALPGPQDGLRRLRILSLRNNKLLTLPTAPLLVDLDISGNPIKGLTRDSFSGVPRLQLLTATQLNNLERFDKDTLSSLRGLTEIRTQTWPEFHLGGTLSDVTSLQKLSVEVRDTALKDQLVGAFHPKMRRVEITGSVLRVAAPDAFAGLDANHELTLQIRGTQMTELPAGLFQKLERIPHLSLDIRDNKFTYLSVDTFYHNTSWETAGTKLVAGGLNLNGNRWVCDCSLAWLGGWLRRWLREVMQVHTVVVEGAQRLQEAARQATCEDTSTGRRVPLIRMRDPGCQASALSRGAATVATLNWTTAVVAAVVAVAHTLR